MKKNEGITLIALVISIIVLLILAAVSIATLTGENGLLSQAERAREKTIEGEEEEQISIAYSAVRANKLGKNAEAKDIKVELENIVGKDKVKVSGSTKIKVQFVDTQNEYIIENGVISKYQKAEATSVYAKVFDTDGDSQRDLLVLSSKYDYDTTEYGTLITDYENQDNTEKQPMGGDDYWAPIWYDYNNANATIRTVIIKDKIVPKSCSYWFSDFEALSRIENIENLDMSNVESMGAMFSMCLNIENLDLSSWDTSSVTNMNALFYTYNNKVPKYKSINLEGWDTSNVTDMTVMFYGCSNLTTLDLTSFDTRNVTDMHGMFSECSNLTILNLTSFDTRNVTDMDGMFSECSNLTTLNLTSFDTRNVTDMSDMFSECSNLTTLDLTSFDTGNVTDMDSMLEGVNAQVYIGEKWNNEITSEQATGYSGTFQYKEI